MASITPTFDLRTAKLSILDTTDVSSIASLSGIFEVISPSNIIIYNNTNYNSPDVTKSSRTKSNISLPLDSKGKVVTGTYRITFKTLSDGVFATQDFTFNFQYVKPISGLKIVADGYNSVLSSVDGTNYAAYTVVSKVRTHSVTPPALSPLSPISQDEDTISFPADIWSGRWRSDLITVITYNINSILVIDQIVDTIYETVYNINMNEIRGYYENYKIAYDELTDLKAKSEISYTLIKIHNSMELYDKAVTYHDLFKAYVFALEIVILLGVTPTTEEIIPFVDPGGGGTPVTDDKWRKLAGVVSPINAGDKVAIGDNTTVGNEILNVNGNLRAVQINLGDGLGTFKIWVDNDGNLTFNDEHNINVKLSDLIAWNPSNKVTLESYTQTEQNLALAVEFTHPPLTSPDEAILLDEGQQIIALQRASDQHDGVLTVDQYNEFHGKQDADDTLDQLAALDIKKGDLLYASDDNTVTRLPKPSAITNPVLSFNYTTVVPVWSTSTSITGTKKQVVYLDDNGLPTSKSTFIFDSGGDVLNVRYLATNKVTFAASVNLEWDGTDLKLVGNSQAIKLKEDGIEITGIERYASHPTFNADTQLVDKKFVDDSINDIGNIVTSNVVGLEIEQSTPANQDLLSWNAATGKWENRTVLQVIPDEYTCPAPTNPDTNLVTWIPLGDVATFRNIPMYYTEERGDKVRGGAIMVLGKGTDAIPIDFGGGNLPNDGTGIGCEFDARINAGIIELGVNVDNMNATDVTLKIWTAVKI